MRNVLGVMLITLALATASATGLSAQIEIKPTPACALLSVAEVKQITGFNYDRSSNGDEPGEGVGGGSSCQWGGSSFMPGPELPLLSLVLIPGKDWTAQARKSQLREGCKRETVTGVGDDAFFQTCPPNPRVLRSPPLYVKAGGNDLLLQIDTKPPVTDASAKTTLVALAKAAVAKLR